MRATGIMKIIHESGSDDFEEKMKTFFNLGKVIDFELLALEKLKDVYETFLKNGFKHTIEENIQLLSDKNVFYHEYFAIIYRLER